MHNRPILISFSTGQLVGVLRNSEILSGKLVVLCPAATGTRIGPQRIFVEIAQKLSILNIASVCVDFPPLGDSYDMDIQKYGGSYSEKLTLHYTRYLQILLDYLKLNYQFNELFILSISDGCMPIYNYAKMNNRVNGLILLSPNHSLDKRVIVNSKNLKQYYLKVFQKDTWIKLVSLQINIKKILRNIYQNPDIKNQEFKDKASRAKNTIQKSLVIFGEKEPQLDDCLKFWQNEELNNNINENSSSVINGADHSFFGWQFKRDVEECIVTWLSEKK